MLIFLKITIVLKDEEAHLRQLHIWVSRKKYQNKRNRIGAKIPTKLICLITVLIMVGP